MVLLTSIGDPAADDDGGVDSRNDDEGDRQKHQE